MRDDGPRRRLNRMTDDHLAGPPERYYLSTPEHPDWREVSKAEFVAAERASGFYNTIGQPSEPATQSFSNSATGVSGYAEGL